MEATSNLERSTFSNNMVAEWSMLKSRAGPEYTKTSLKNLLGRESEKYNCSQGRRPKNSAREALPTPTFHNGRQDLTCTGQMGSCLPQLVAELKHSWHAWETEFLIFIYLKGKSYGESEQASQMPSKARAWLDWAGLGWAGPKPGVWMPPSLPHRWQWIKLSPTASLGALTGNSAASRGGSHSRMSRHPPLLFNNHM